MPNILNIYKPKGLSPLQTINLLRKKMPEYKDETIGFAGRLDPLAHGVLLLMVGEETTREKDKYLNLPKEYEFEAVFGVSTDTYDALGLPNPKTKSLKVIKNNLDDFRLDDLMTFINSKLGKQTQSYPPYSSKTVNGIPLYKWAKEEKLDEIRIPTREIEIYDFKLIETKTIDAEKLKKEIFRQINLVDGDFRQEQIKNEWNTFFANYEGLKTNNQFLTAKLKISCSSGTYVRSLVHDLGNYLGMGAIALDILRTKVGLYVIKNCIRL